MPNKKITLHPKNSDGQLDVNTNIYPKTTLDNVYTSDGNTPYSDTTFQKALTAGDGIKLTGVDISVDFTSSTLKTLLLNSLYPVGAIYTSTSISSDSKCPIEKTLGGTWARIEDTFLLAAGNRYSNGSTGGSADAVLLKHKHTTQTKLTSTLSAGDHTHNSFSTTTYIHKDGLHAGTDLSYLTNNTINANDTEISTFTASGGSHTHSITIPNLTTTEEGTESSGTGKNMPPYLVVYVWKRTA